MSKSKGEKSAKNNATTETTVPEEATTDVAVVPGQNLSVLTANLPEGKAENVERLLAILNPNKPGFEEMGGARVRPPIVKIHQLMTTDAPEGSRPGGYITNTGEIIGEQFKFIALYMFYSHVRFREDEKIPSCGSEDGVMSRSGDVCAVCPDRPFRDNMRTDCSKQINAYAVDTDFTRVYHIQFSKTSYRAGSKLYQQAGSTLVPWARAYNLSSEAREGKGKYWVMTVAAGKDVDPALFKVAEYLNRLITDDRQEYLAKLREQAKQNKDAVDNLSDDIAGGDSDAPSSSSGGDFTDL